MFNGFENIEDLLLPHAPYTFAGRLTETALVWNPLGQRVSNPFLSQEVKRQWLIHGEVDPRQWNLYAASHKEFFDVTLCNSYYAYLQYILTGKKSPIWAIPLGSYQYIPSLTSHLVKGPHHLYSFYFKKEGVGVDVRTFMCFKEIDFGFVGDVWRQNLLWGGRLGLDLTFNLLEDNHLHGSAGSGFKTAGTFPGYSQGPEKYLKWNVQLDF